MDFLYCISVPEVGVGVHDEAHGENLGAHLHGVDARENWFQLLLKIFQQYQFVISLGQTRE